MWLPLGFFGCLGAVWQLRLLKDGDHQMDRSHFDSERQCAKLTVSPQTTASVLSAVCGVCHWPSVTPSVTAALFVREKAIA